MSGRRIRCSWCGVQLTVPPRAQNIQCAVCKAVTRVQQNDRLPGQAQSSLHDATNKLKGFLNTVSSNINSMVASVNNYPMQASSYGSYAQPARPISSLMPFPAKGKKRAVLCAVSYYGQRHRLKGTVNDVRCMKYFLVERMGFPNDSILLLSEEEPNPSLIPTKYNIRKALQWLVQGCQSGDSLVFHYSGHGSQQRDLNGDEIDGYDEMLLPVDHQIEGTILDDEINATIVKPLPSGAKLHAIIDACHSGTVLDLPFLCRMNSEGYYVWEDHGFLSSTYKGTSGGLAISFSACDDHQVSVDTMIEQLACSKNVTGSGSLRKRCHRSHDVQLHPSCTKGTRIDVWSPAEFHEPDNSGCQSWNTSKWTHFSSFEKSIGHRLVTGATIVVFCKI
ncbi:metacaspase-1 isoform X4 [Coffea arabica]|uniref:Metacaspase-1 isoform X4 n=1 Tax=Coffea arabica TaxID=13443 RepID=A0A6P6VUP0_COFAR|nr:metacaspase-1-like isoform X3 [Coffea arabica]